MGKNVQCVLQASHGIDKRETLLDNDWEIENFTRGSLGRGMLLVSVPSLESWMRRQTRQPKSERPRDKNIHHPCNKSNKKRQNNNTSLSKSLLLSLRERRENQANSSSSFFRHRISPAYRFLSQKTDSFKRTHHSQKASGAFLIAFLPGIR